MNENLRRELMSSFQHLAILLIAVVVAFVIWLPLGDEGQINIYEAWRAVWSYGQNLVITFAVLSAGRVAIVGYVNYKRASRIK